MNPFMRPDPRIAKARADAKARARRRAIPGSPLAANNALGVTTGPRRNPSIVTGGTEAKEQATIAKEAAAQAADPGVADYGLEELLTGSQYMEDPTLLGQSARAGVQADPAAIAAQQRAMSELFGLYEGGGATALERARMAETRANEDQYLRSQREAHQQDLTERGMSGSGAEIAALLGDRQAAGQRMSMADLQTESMLQDRALSALMEGNKVAGQIRDSSFSEGKDRGTAQDEFSLLNNTLINNAKTSNTDFLRQAKADMEKNKFDAWQRGLDRGVDAAGKVMDFDASENKEGWDSGRALATGDANAFNNANDRVHDTVSEIGRNAVTNFDVATGTNHAIGAANAAGNDADRRLVGGAGKTADGVTNAFAGAYSGGATSFAPTGQDDDEEDK